MLPYGVNRRLSVNTGVGLRLCAGFPFPRKYAAICKQLYTDACNCFQLLAIV
nr:MAG TPA: hypothetical protein [Caudoviricetes sp.]